jgi:cysteine-rich repeat protein
MRVLLLSGLSLSLSLSLVAGCSVLIDARFDQDGAGPLCVEDEDGTPCEPLGVSGEFICVSEACTSSFCGDGFVDARRGEACDDANTVSGDGCEPFDCAPSCALAAECDDTQPCNGTESCVSGACVAGSALADGEVCGTGLACRGGSCASLLCGNMVIDQGEDCDDDNLVAGDGLRERLHVHLRGRRGLPGHGHECVRRERDV